MWSACEREVEREGLIQRLFVIREALVVRASEMMKSVIGRRTQSTFKASVSELGNALVIMSAARRCILIKAAAGVITAALCPQHTAA